MIHQYCGWQFKNDDPSIWDGFQISGWQQKINKSFPACWSFREAKGQRQQGDKGVEGQRSKQREIQGIQGLARCPCADTWCLGRFCWEQLCGAGRWSNPLIQDIQGGPQFKVVYKPSWLVVWNIFYFPIYWEFHHPNRWSPSLFRGVGWNHQPSSSFIWLLQIESPDSRSPGFRMPCEAVMIHEIWIFNHHQSCKLGYYNP